MNESYQYRSLDGITRGLALLLVLSWIQLELLNRGNVTEKEAAANDLREQVVGLSQMGLMLVTVITFGTWIVRANKNARALGANDLPTSPGWAVGYFFVPILNLFRPYQAMRELSLASQAPRGWQTLTASPILPLWWTLWIRLSLHAEDLQSIKAATQAVMAAQVVELPLSVVAMILIFEIAGDQRITFQRLNPDESSAPSPDWSEEPPSAG